MSALLLAVAILAGGTLRGVRSGVILSSSREYRALCLPPKSRCPARPSSLDKSNRQTVGQRLFGVWRVS